MCSGEAGERPVNRVDGNRNIAATHRTAMAPGISGADRQPSGQPSGRYRSAPQLIRSGSKGIGKEFLRRQSAQRHKVLAR